MPPLTQALHRPDVQQQQQDDVELVLCVCVCCVWVWQLWLLQPSEETANRFAGTETATQPSPPSLLTPLPFSFHLA